MTSLYAQSTVEEQFTTASHICKPVDL